MSDKHESVVFAETVAPMNGIVTTANAVWEEAWERQCPEIRIFP